MKILRDYYVFAQAGDARCKNYKQRDGKLKGYVRNKLGLFDVHFLLFSLQTRVIILRERARMYSKLACRRDVFKQHETREKMRLSRTEPIFN